MLRRIAELFDERDGAAEALDRLREGRVDLVDRAELVQRTDLPQRLVGLLGALQRQLGVERGPLQLVLEAILEHQRVCGEVDVAGAAAAHDVKLASETLESHSQQLGGQVADFLEKIRAA